MTDIITAPIRFVAGLPVVAAETAINLLTDWNKFDCEEQDDYNVSFVSILFLCLLFFISFLKLIFLL